MDISLYYEEHGAGEPLVLLHGNGEDSRYFAGQIPFFADRYRVIAVDTRGHGRSPRGKAPFTLTQFAEDLHALLDALAIEKVSLLGFSDGGNIDLLFALRWQEQVEKLILNGANLDPTGVRRRYQKPIEAAYAAAAERAGEDEAIRREAELLGLMVNEPHIDPSSLSALDMPVLVIAGTGDMIRQDHTRLIARSIPGAALALAQPRPGAARALLRSGELDGHDV